MIDWLQLACSVIEGPRKKYTGLYTAGQLSARLGTDKGHLKLSGEVHVLTAITGSSTLLCSKVEHVPIQLVLAAGGGSSHHQHASIFYWMSFFASGPSFWSYLLRDFEVGANGYFGSAALRGHLLSCRRTCDVLSVYKHYRSDNELGSKLARRGDQTSEIGHARIAHPPRRL
eukprot:1870992-Pleurochrysis_carterae.AAC.1